MKNQSSKKINEDCKKRIKFYDTCCIFLAVSLAVSFVLFVLSLITLYSDSLIASIFFYLRYLIAIIISWGMIYHEFKRKDWLWIVLTIILLVVAGGGVLIALLYYFFVMRKEFKKGKGIYPKKIPNKKNNPDN